MKISDIIRREEYILSEVADDLEFNGMKIRLEEIEDGDILIIPNSQRIPDYSNGKILPIAVICDSNAVLPGNIPAIRVENPRIAMSRAFFRYHNPDLNNMKIIGVTGTNGKTSTATLISKVLSDAGYKTGFIGTGKITIDDKEINETNYSMTTPDPDLLYSALKQMSIAGCSAVVMEVSSHALALDKVTPLIFDYGIFTNMSKEHTDFHGDMDNYFAAKLKLFDLCRCGIFNIDDVYAKRAYELCKTRKISIGIIWRGDCWATNINNRGFAGVEYIYHQRDFSFKTKLSLPGIYNTYNSMLAAALCIDMGCKPCDVKNSIEQISNISGRYEIIKSKISVIIDYAHTPAAFESILKELSLLKSNKRLTVVFGCGGDRDREKRPLMAKFAEKYADRIIVTSDNSRRERIKDIICDIIRGFERGKYEIIENRADAISEAIVNSQDGDIVAIIGKGPEKYNIDSSGYHSFDEKEIISSALLMRDQKRL